MKFFYFWLIIFCGLAVGNARATHWVEVVGTSNSQIFVDTDSIIRMGNIVAAWYRRDFQHTMPVANSHRTYKSSKIYNFYNCSANEIASAEWITYSEKGGLGNIVTKDSVSPLEYADIPLGETGKPVFDFICKHAK